MRKNVVSILLALAFVILLPAPAARADDFDVGTLRERYAILVDATDPTTALYGIEKNADTQCATGSTIKILTCMLAIESGRLDEEATVSENAVNFNKKYNSLMGLETGQKWTIRDLLYGLMLPSGNDAAIAIAEQLAGSTKAFAKLMNDKAAELGMTHSHFVTVHGKDNKDHYSTARDMAILTAWALQNETFRQIVATTTYTCTDTSGNNAITLQNTNRLLIDAESDGTYTPISCLYPDAIGVKTGDTNAAGKCFIAAATRGGVTLIAVLLGGTLDDQEYLDKSANMNAKTKDPYNAQRFEDAVALFNYGFKQMSQLLTVQDLIDMGMPVSFPCEVQNAAKNDPENGLLTVSPRLDATQQLQLMTPFLEKLTENIGSLADTKIGTLVAPINAGDVVGTVEYKVGDSKLFSSNLYANRSVKEGILSNEPETVTSSDGKVSLVGTYNPVTFAGEDGSILTYKTGNFSTDHVCPGRTLFKLYDRTGKETEFYSLRQGIFIFLPGGGHLIFGTAIDNSGIRSETDGRTACVHGDITCSDDDRLLAECGSVSEIYCSHEIDSGEYVLQVFARNTEFLALLGADSDCEALIALISELLDRYVFSYFNAASEFDAKLLQYVYLGIEDILLQSEAGDACHQHTAGNRVLIEDRDIHKACCCKEICGSHAGGACSDNGYLFFKVSSDLGFYNRRNVAGLGIDVPAGYEVLDIVDRKSLVDIASRAGILASLVAYASAYGGEGIHFLY